MFYKVTFNRNRISEIKTISDNAREIERSEYYTENGKNIYDHIYIHASDEEDLKMKVAQKVIPLD